MINRTVTVLVSILVAVSDVFGILMAPLPQNKAVLKGTTGVSFNCSSSLYWRYISWSFVPVLGVETKAITTGDQTTDTYTYEVGQSGDLVNILRIKTVNESLAGIYICSEGAVGSASAQLIVYNSDPVCTSNVGSDTHLYQGQSVQMSCSFSYTANSSYVSANMVWSEESPSSPVVSTLVITTTGTLTVAVSTITEIVGYSSPFPVYQCKTSFKVTGNSAKNDAGYSNTSRPFPSPINVSYFNPLCSIKGTNPGDKIYPGTNISCQVDANPPPNYQWHRGQNETLSDTATVQIWEDGEYTCAAWNNVGRCQLSSNFTTYSTPSSTSNRGGLSDENKKIVIGVVVGVGGALLFVLLIVIICRCCIKKKPEDKFQDNGNVNVDCTYANEPSNAAFSLGDEVNDDGYCGLNKVNDAEPKYCTILN